jgi:hypothetical protein
MEKCSQQFINALNHMGYDTSHIRLLSNRDGKEKFT